MPPSETTISTPAPPAPMAAEAQSKPPVSVAPVSVGAGSAIFPAPGASGVPG